MNTVHGTGFAVFIDGMAKKVVLAILLVLWSFNLQAAFCDWLLKPWRLVKTKSSPFTEEKYIDELIKVHLAMAEASRALAQVAVAAATLEDWVMIRIGEKVNVEALAARVTLSSLSPTVIAHEQAATEEILRRCLAGRGYDYFSTPSERYRQAVTKCGFKFVKHLRNRLHKEIARFSEIRKILDEDFSDMPEEFVKEHNEIVAQFDDLLELMRRNEREIIRQLNDHSVSGNG